jgi:hypothetical protein
MKFSGWIVACLLACAGPAMAEAGWFESGDTVLRGDLMLLNDAGIIRLPVTQWPVPRSAVRFAVENAKGHFATNRAVMLALERVRSRLAGSRPGARGGFLGDVRVTAGEPALLRQFDTLGRENGEVSASAGYATERFEASVRAAAVADPSDGQTGRLDGSHATLRLGNWLLTANTLERFWGPGHEGSLILSNNARPMPTVAVERATAAPFETRWLSWLGPWTTSFGISRMESERQDIDAPLFMAWRVAIMPFHDMQIGFSRTAQFCGKQLECNLSVFGNLLVGNDNVGIDATRENEPGNQMAGFDLRWSSPIGNLPYAVYGQYIGEDESGYLPVKPLAQIGAETWFTTGAGGLVQAFAEWADTACSATTRRGPYLNCAYNQGRFNVEGYRYRGRVIGHTTDRDSTSIALGVSYVEPGGAVWSATARSAKLNRDGNFDPVNTVTQFRTDYAALELGWRGVLFKQAIAIDLGAESIERTGEDRELSPYGFVRWTYDLQP